MIAAIGLVMGSPPSPVPCHEPVANSIAMLAVAVAMSDFPFDLVGFDLDGTLVDSAPDLAAAVNHVLEGEGRPPLTVEQVHAMMGGGARLLLDRALKMTGNSERVDALMPKLLDYYAEHIAVLTRPFPHVVETLDALAARDVTLAVMTNKLEHLAVRLLTELGLLERFACVIGGDTLGVTKPDPAPIREMIARCNGRRAAFVGDTIYDVEAARNAGIPCVLFAPKGAGQALGAAATIASYESLVAVLSEIAK
jgi:phosphoglycolate phosphatase